MCPLVQNLMQFTTIWCTLYQLGLLFSATNGRGCCSVRHMTAAWHEYTHEYVPHVQSLNERHAPSMHPFETLMLWIATTCLATPNGCCHAFTSFNLQLQAAAKHVQSAALLYAHSQTPAGPVPPCITPPTAPYEQQQKLHRPVLKFCCAQCCGQTGWHICIHLCLY